MAGLHVLRHGKLPPAFDPSGNPGAEGTMPPQSLTFTPDLAVAMCVDTDGGAFFLNVSAKAPLARDGRWAQFSKSFEAETRLQVDCLPPRIEIEVEFDLEIHTTAYFPTVTRAETGGHPNVTEETIGFEAFFPEWTADLKCGELLGTLDPASFAEAYYHGPPHGAGELGCHILQENGSTVTLTVRQELPWEAGPCVYVYTQGARALENRGVQDVEWTSIECG